MAAVSYRGVAIDQLEVLAVVAARIGLTAEFAAAFQEITDRLRADPEGWGDPVRDLPGLHLTYYIHYGPILTVDYAVHIDGSPVFVMNVQPRRDTPLDFAVG
jgi:hypothetical protein